MNPRQRLIKKLNENFNHVIGFEIPKDHGISQQRVSLDAGGFKWFFHPLRGAPDYFNGMGSQHTITELLKTNVDNWMIAVPTELDYPAFEIMIRECLKNQSKGKQ